MHLLKNKRVSSLPILILILLLVFFGVSSCNKDPIPGENEFQDKRDGWIYKTVDIGDNIWMAQNLAYLPQADTFDVESDSVPFYYIFDYNEPKLSIAKQTTNYFSFGVLYNWTAALEVCPEGWHLPSDSEWKDLEIFAGMSQENANEFGYRESGAVGEKLKSSTNWDKDGNGLDAHGFNAKPGGRRSAISGRFLNLGTQAFFWTSTPDTLSNAILRYMESDTLGVHRIESSRKNGVSVRCVKN